ncbi:MAG TPA: glycosyltransferase family 4 protein [Xanthobacteraceae bacterium]|nr:glycosyltransferase family 4 protein [Xanthobacteraceae bacterium]
MRILQIIHDQQRGGVQKLAGMIEQGLAPRRVTFKTAYLYSRADLSAPQKLLGVLRMIGRIWRRDFDVLIAYQSTASILVGVVGSLAGCRLRIVHQTCTPSEMPRLLRVLDMIVGTLGLYTVNIANSVATWSEFARYPKTYRRAMILIEHGLDAPAPMRNRDAVRRFFCLPASQPLLLNVGRLAPQKNQEVLVRALACLPQAHLVVAGDGPQQNALHTLAVTLGVDDRLHLLGALEAEDIADLYAATDLFVFPSVWETFGLAAVEAAMAGLPMVVSDLPVLREVLRVDGAEPVGFVASHDTEGWISALGKALETPSGKTTRTAFARGMITKYSRQRMIESYLSLFDAYTRSQPGDTAALPPGAEEAHS